MLTRYENNAKTLIFGRCTARGKCLSRGKLAATLRRRRLARGAAGPGNMRVGGPGAPWKGSGMVQRAWTGATGAACVGACPGSTRRRA